MHAKEPGATQEEGGARRTHPASRRYQPQMILPEIGPQGQDRLRSAAVLVAGLGGLGSPAAMYLAAAGVGRLGLVDCDTIDESNLHRQVLYSTADVGKGKVDCAAARLSAMNPEIEISLHRERMTAGNAVDLVGRYDIVLDGTDNFATRYLINDACGFAKKPLVSAAIHGFEAQLAVFHYRGGPCYRCLFPEPPPPGAAPSCARAGVLGVLPGVVGCLQATEVLKIILERGAVLTHTLLLYDALAATFDRLAISSDPTCALCGNAPTITRLLDPETLTCVQPDNVGLSPVEISARELAAILRDVVLVDVRDEHEREDGAIEPALHIPLWELAARAGEIPRDRAKVIVYCATGLRSRQAQALLADAGFTNVFSLAQGIEGWKSI